MSRRQRVLWSLVVCVGLGLFLGTVESLEARTLSVDISRCGATGVYCQIQDAVDAALPGDTIRVAAGTYGPVVIPMGKDNITIREARNNSNPVIYADTGIGVKLDANRVTIRGLTVKDPTPASPNKAGFVVNGNNNFLWDNTATDNTNGFNVFGFFGGVGNVLLANTAENNSYGFEVNSSSGHTLIGNLAINNGFSGFLLEKTTGSTLMLNAARGNGHHGFLIESESENNTFRRNTAELNGGFGFKDNGSGNIFVNNQCNGNTVGPSDPLGIC